MYRCVELCLVVGVGIGVGVELCGVFFVVCG